MNAFLLISSYLFFSFSFSFQASAQDRSWLTLLHYQAKGEGAWESSIDRPDFFLAENGRFDPKAEWRATEAALTSAKIQIQGKEWDPACAFPARQLFMERRGRIPARRCAEFDLWQNEIRLRSLSLVFSSAYAGNSASMFGHTLLKLNRDGTVRHDLLDYGLGFMAHTNPEDGAALYTFKGLFGGYPGFFTLQPYYQLVNQYAFSENRDLWELEIPLSEEERLIFLAHLWELLHHGSSAYYFTHVNCSSMLAEVLDAVKPDWRLRERLHGFVLPSEVMRSAARQLPESGAMTFRPSQRRLWEERLEKLSAAQRALFRDVWKDRSVLVAAQDPDVLDAILDRITMEKSRMNLTAQDGLRRFESETLLARSALPASAAFVAREAANNPLRGHAPAQFALLGGRDAAKASFGLRLRWGWHDLLDPAEGFDSHYHLNVLDLRWLRNEDDEQRARLKVAEVWSLSPWSVEDPLWSWILGGGWEGQERAESWDQRLTFEGSAGLSFGSESSLIGILPGIQLAQPLGEAAATEGDVRMTFLYLQRWTRQLRTLVRFLPGLAIGREDRIQGDWDAEGRWDFKKGWQAQLHVARNESLRWELGAARSF